MSESLNDRLANDLKAAMKSGDRDRRDVIRLIRSAFKNREIELRGPLSDDESIEVIQAQIKQRRDSIEAYESAGRDDLASNEKRELDIIIEYLPETLRPIDSGRLREIVIAKVNELELTGPGDMRVLMPALIAETEGRADNRLLSTLASEILLQRQAGS